MALTTGVAPEGDQNLSSPSIRTRISLGLGFRFSDTHGLHGTPLMVKRNPCLW